MTSMSNVGVQQAKKTLIAIDQWVCDHRGGRGRKHEKREDGGGSDVGEVGGGGSPVNSLNGYGWAGVIHPDLGDLVFVVTSPISVPFPTASRRDQSLIMLYIN
ncbi:hypothetical protein BJ165DRAFT_1409878 [Panaeolus papilionaceus]|nr:hypothetical protein BJ165DRAFT_1409878 [Panaeolus papilionaceus]